MKKTKVAIVQTNQQPTKSNIEAAVKEAIHLAGGLDDVIKANDTVLIKPNLCATWSQESGAITDPSVCSAIADIVRERNAKPVIGESAAIGFDTEEVIRLNGYDTLREKGYEVIDLKASGLETIKVPIPNGRSMKEVILPKIVVEADVIIDVPKMKTHDQTIATLGLKNLKGYMPDSYKRKFHHSIGVFQGCADLCLIAKPTFSVVDGILAMEGLGPVMGDPVEMGLIIAGKDLVAVDAVTIAVMGHQPMEDGCVRAAVETGIGIADLEEIEVLGVSIDRVRRRFKLAEEALAAVAFPDDFKILMDDKTCTGCKLTVMEVFMDVEKQGKLGEAEGMTVIAGKMDELPDINKSKLLLIGACTARYKRDGIFVEGCPPNNRDVCEGLSKLGLDVDSGVAKVETLEE